MRWRTTYFCASRGQQNLQTYDVGTPGKLLALAIHPENAEGEGSVDPGLGFLRIDTEDG